MTAMRHRVAHRKLGRVTEHRIAMLRNQATALLRHEHLDDDGAAGEGTAAVRRAAHHDRQARRGRRATRTARRCNARRLVMHDLQDRDVVTQAVRHARAALRGAAGRLHAPAAPRLPPGRRAEIAQVELVGSEFNPRRRPKRKPPRPKRAPKPKGVGGRLRAAAERLRGGRRTRAATAAEEGRRKPSRRQRAQDDDAAQGRRQLSGTRSRQVEQIVQCSTNGPARRDRDSRGLSFQLELPATLPPPPRPRVRPSPPR